MAELVFIIPCLFNSKPHAYGSSKYVSNAYHENLVFSMRYRPVKRQVQLVRRAKTFPDAQETFGRVASKAIMGVSIKTV